MSIDKQKLKELAQAVKAEFTEYSGRWPQDDDWFEPEMISPQMDYTKALSPDVVLALLAEIERLESYSHDLETQGNAVRDSAEMVASYLEMGASKAQQALRKDAERYRWLRRQPNDCSAPRIDICHWKCNGDDSVNEGEGLREAEADDAIDAAMAKEAK